jgi:hypothetical protein
MNNHSIFQPKYMNGVQVKVEYNQLLKVATAFGVR